MQNPAEFSTAELDALADRHPEHADLIRVIKAQMVTAARNPQSEATRAALAASVARLAQALGAS